MSNCSYCGTPLKPAGNKRKNGRSDFIDWNGRKIHLSCYSIFKRSNELIQFYL